MTQFKKYSVVVAMSVYKGDNARFIKASVESILQQTYSDFVLCIIVDGIVSEEIKILLMHYSNIDNVDLIWKDNNLGLATRMNETIELANEKYHAQYFARMDADDISAPIRLQEQVSYLNNNLDVSILGSDVIEIDEFNNELGYKKMTCKHDLLVKKVIMRCPFNHPTVMFRLSDINRNSLRYKPQLQNTQDYYLWVDAIASGLKLANLNTPLLNFRIDSGFYKRRGLKKLINDVKGRIYAYKKIGRFNILYVIYVVVLLLGLRLSPSLLKNQIYRYLR